MASLDHLVDLLLTAYRGTVLALAIVAYVLSLAWVYDLIVSGLTGSPPRHLVAFWQTFAVSQRR